MNFETFAVYENTSLYKPIKTVSLNTLGNTNNPDSSYQHFDKPFHPPFHQLFHQLIEHVNNTQINASQKMQGLEAGEDNLIETVMAMQKANQTMSMMIQVRNRLVDGYQEVFNQQI